MKSIMILLFAVLFAGCSGGGSGSGGGSRSDPYLSFSLDKYQVSRGEIVYGTAHWEGTENISQVFADETYLTARWSYSYPASQFNLKGYAGSNRIWIKGNSNASLGNHHFSIWVVDVKGRPSNRVEFDVNVQGKENTKELDIEMPFLLFGTR